MLVHWVGDTAPSIPTWDAVTTTSAPTCGAKAIQFRTGTTPLPPSATEPRSNWIRSRGSNISIVQRRTRMTTIAPNLPD
jgi:hypothetical protein